jgi:fluoroquinolone transport system permease protein
MEQKIMVTVENSTQSINYGSFSGLKTMLVEDLKLQKLYGISPVYMLVTAIYIIILWFLPADDIGSITIFLVITDPVFLGMLFISVLVYFEKSENVLEALVCTPLETRSYLTSKVLSLLIVSTMTSCLIILIPYGIKHEMLGSINFGWFILGVVLSSIPATLFGFALGSRFKTFNEYMMGLLGVIVVLMVPALGYFGWVDSWIFYIFPSHAAFLLTGASIRSISTGDLLYSIFYLLAMCKICWFLAEKSFVRYIIQNEPIKEKNNHD